MKTYFQRSTKERENLKKSDLKGFFFQWLNPRKTSIMHRIILEVVRFNLVE